MRSVPVPPTSLRDSSRFQFFPRIVATRSRGNVAGPHSSVERPPPARASRTDFNALPVLFSLYTITAQFAAWISVKPF